MNHHNSKSSLIVAIVGQGYVGLPLARAFVASGVMTIGLESNMEVVQNLRNRNSHVEDISSQDLNSMFESGNYVVQTEVEIVSKCDAIILCVPTPLDDKGIPDLGILKRAVTDIAPHLSRDAILISESTSFPGTLRNVIQPIVVANNPFGSEVHLATAPERVDPGNKSWNQGNTPRLISGLTKEASKKAIEVYARICDSPLLVSSPEVAESAKLLENSFRLINIAFIDEFSRSMINLGINAIEVIEAASTKPFGFMKFTPGLGAGGHCIPVDPVYLSKTLEENEILHPLLQQAIKSNQEAFQIVVNRVKTLERQPQRILIVGLSYKKGINDLRESPAIKVFYELKRSYEVFFYDDEIQFLDNFERTSNLNGYDLVLILVPQTRVSASELLEGNRRIWNCSGTRLSQPSIKDIFDGVHNE